MQIPCESNEISGNAPYRFTLPDLICLEGTTALLKRQFRSVIHKGATTVSSDVMRHTVLFSPPGKAEQNKALKVKVGKKKKQKQRKCIHRSIGLIRKPTISLCCAATFSMTMALGVRAGCWLGHLTFYLC